MFKKIFILPENLSAGWSSGLLHLGAVKLDFVLTKNMDKKKFKHTLFSMCGSNLNLTFPMVLKFTRIYLIRHITLVPAKIVCFVLFKFT